LSKLNPDDELAKQKAAEEAAGAIWNRSQPIVGTIAETYLRRRAYTGLIPAILRFAMCKHPTDDTRYYPTMIAGVVIGGQMDQGVGIHRTFLKDDGSGKADLDPDKMTLGASKGAAVPLGQAGRLLAVSEGLETGLSYMQMTGTPTWAALSTAGIRNLILPAEVQEVIIAADPDIPGIRAAHEAAQRWLLEGRRVRIAKPPVRFDFNDLLKVYSHERNSYAFAGRP
jgi:putative DNA primase/helicase